MTNFEQDFSITITPRQPQAEIGVADTDFPMSVKPREAVVDPAQDFQICVKPRTTKPEPVVPDFNIQTKLRAVQSQEDFDLNAKPHTAAHETDFPLVIKKKRVVFKSIPVAKTDQ